MKYELWYSVVVRDRNRKVVSRERRKSRSLLKQWNQVVYCQATQSLLNITDTGGTPRSGSGSTSVFRMIAAAGYTTAGIRVGTGNTPVAIDDYALETPIAEGAGAGQMEHLISTVAAPSVVAAPSSSFLVSRSIVNNSPGVITVREAAIYGKIVHDNYYGCLVRDVFTVPQAVPIGGAITVDWTIGVTV